ncbi:uncharacterized protein L201_003051 [Kwoniella dendrophila CBS 6074]|uniref:Glycosyltransferase family 32 protein n=1 Tax=Kwoniella dendrophila CBS 6074 TaxID=1295534 RepID=A0AAX4JSL1_9TREE
MDPNGTWRAGKAKSLVNQVNDSRSSSDAESSQQGWSGAEWNTNTNSRPSLSSGDERLPSPIQTYPSQPYDIALNPNVPHRRSTITKSSLHTVGSNVSLDGLNHSRQLNGSGSAILDINSTSSHTHPSHSPIFTSNGYSQQPGSSTSSASASAYASTSYARSRRRETEVEIETEEDEDHYNNNQNIMANSSNPGRLKIKKRNRGSSFSLPVHRKRRISTSLPWLTRWWPGGGGGGTGHSGSHIQQSKQKLSKTSPLKLILYLVLMIGSLIWGISIWKKHYEIQVEFSVFNKKWIKSEIDSISNLKGCFNNPSSEYNITKHLSPKKNMLSPGISLKRGMSCYDFSSTIQTSNNQNLESMIYHTYWRSDLIQFNERQITTLLSFLATQPLEYSKLILWTNGKSALSENVHLKPFLQKWGEYIEIKQVDMSSLTKNTDLHDVLSPSSKDQNTDTVFDAKGWVDGDAIRLLVLWHFGGIWLDMDQILTRDLHPLTDQEWVTQWDCYDKPYYALNGALMHFEKHSPYLCEAFHIMATSPFPEPNTFTWGSHLYSKLHRALLSSHLKPFSVLPWCFADPRNCRTDNRFPDPFSSDPDTFAGKKWQEESGREELEERVGQVWSVHLHNQWYKNFPENGWVQRLLNGYQDQLKRLEIYAQAKGLVDQTGRIKLTNDD